MGRLIDENTVKTAARVGEKFQLDPVMILAESDPFLWAVRVAAYGVTQQDAKEAADRSRHTSSVGRSSRPAVRRGRR